jgi:hypothetical protein
MGDRLKRTGVREVVEKQEEDSRSLQVRDFAIFSNSADGLGLCVLQGRGRKKEGSRMSAYSKATYAIAIMIINHRHNTVNNNDHNNITSLLESKEEFGRC